MKNLFLLNRLGFNPDLTTRQSRVDSVSIASRYRVLAILLLFFIIGSGNVWGETETLFSLTGTSGYTIPTGWSQTNVSGGNYLLFNNNGSTLTSPLYDPHDNVSLTFSVATYGNTTNHNLEIRVLNSSGVVQATYYTATPTSTTYVSKGSPIDLGDIDYSFKIQFYLKNNNKGVRLRNITLTGDAAASEASITVTQNSSPISSIAFGTVTTASGNVTIHAEGECLQDLYGYKLDAAITGFDESNFKVANNSSATFNSFSQDMIISYTGLSAAKTYNATLTIGGYKAADCKEYGAGTPEYFSVDIPLSVTYEPACTITPAMSFTNTTVNKLTTDGAYTQTVNITNKGAGQTVAYSSSNTSVATVNSSGVVTLKGVAGSATITASVALNGTYCANSASYTINVTVPKYTVTWSVNGSTYQTTSNVSYNTKTSTPANPSVPDECTGSTFMGWTSNSGWASDSAPGDLFNGTSPTITGNITFYAVFADEK